MIERIKELLKIGRLIVPRTVKETIGIKTLDPSSGLYRKRTPFERPKHQNLGACGYKEGEMFWQYYCDLCDGELVPGPSGAGTNQVCKHCHVNFGCLDGALEA